ncbi:alpha,alpha-phosphotrehalase [Alkalihalobacillus pseudalcaliphilus]|uniref:alpha,alpha-phosphotrehalase n=1 Tax=Alkalihalobacillus pseudalcaliphilus TaxID=79884 RepID=UPI00064D8CCC|nr:alpha,alpha-phosphotrehalase [Alkalihalobacillus pseudalcaliphilus]KMK75050.1 trehalose-6-phosphate hydrolase [Alkalihalobacillus pseudalcaliphilus]
MNEWWRRSVVYQIYPKSFNDTTGSGQGDIQGITEKLDYLKELGVDVIWLTPIYASPQNDNGYDISDYYSIEPEYGTMADFEELLEEVHNRDMKLIMDLVVNHTSTEHQWFQEAKKSKDNPYRDYYIWKDPVQSKEPTNWQSKFGGSAWKYDEKTDQYYLHLFDQTQADLNWENEKLRKHVYEMMHFWFDKGIDGFRLDVINLISKDQSFPNETDPNKDGRRFYTDGPRVHEFLQEMNQEVLSKYQTMTVGEMSSTSIEHCIKYSNPKRNELSMTFNFHHLKVDYRNGQKWELAPFDFAQLKQILSTWQVEMAKGGGWNALFWCNHDQPRVVSRYGDDKKYHHQSAKMLATAIHLMQGTPYIYQGEEIGMTNPGFTSIQDYRDVETLNAYKALLAEGKSEERAIEIIQERSRDNSRTPMQWSDETNAGFTSGTPWIGVSKNYRDINVVQALKDEDSIFYHYQKLIQMRKKYDIITYGDFEIVDEDNDQIFAYIRKYGQQKLLVINNFYAERVMFEVPKTISRGHAELLLNNDELVPPFGETLTLEPYQSVVYLIEG